MAHKLCIEKMKEHIWCDCILDDLAETKKLRKLLSKYMLKDLCRKLAKDDKALSKIVQQVYGDKK